MDRSEVGTAHAPDPAHLRAILAGSRRIAVLGASGRAGRPAHDVTAYLERQGYEIVPVNPHRYGETMFGGVVHARLRDIAEAVDVVDVFRRAEDLPAHLPDLLAMRPLPGVVWFQSGIRNDEVARDLRAAGIDVVQDRCTKIDHRALIGESGRPAARG